MLTVDCKYKRPNPGFGIWQVVRLRANLGIHPCPRLIVLTLVSNVNYVTRCVTSYLIGQRFLIILMRQPRYYSWSEYQGGSNIETWMECLYNM